MIWVDKVIWFCGGAITLAVVMVAVYKVRPFRWCVMPHRLPGDWAHRRQIRPCVLLPPVPAPTFRIEPDDCDCEESTE